MEGKMEERPIRLKTEVTVIDRAGIVGRGIIIGRSYSDPMRYDVATAEKIITDLTRDELDV